MPIRNALRRRNLRRLHGSPTTLTINQTSTWTRTRWTILLKTHPSLQSLTTSLVTRGRTALLSGIRNVDTKTPNSDHSIIHEVRQMATCLLYSCAEDCREHHQPTQTTNAVRLQPSRTILDPHIAYRTSHAEILTRRRAQSTTERWPSLC